MGRYDGKRVLVTGGTSGIGLAVARLVLDEGARVLATGRTDASVAATGEALGPSATVLRSDVAVPADADELAERARADLGGLDLVVANAGMTAFVPFGSVTEQTWDELFAVNTRGPYFLLQKLAPLLAPGGSIVLVTSVADVKGLAGSSVYAASKAAVRSLVRSLARELLDRGVRVNAVSPGPIDTGILERSLPAQAAAANRERLVGTNPMARFGRPEEVAAAVAFLGFEATYTTGAEFPVDGGTSQL